MPRPGLRKASAPATLTWMSYLVEMPGALAQPTFGVCVAVAESSMPQPGLRKASAPATLTWMSYLVEMPGALAQPTFGVCGCGRVFDATAGASQSLSPSHPDVDVLPSRDAWCFGSAYFWGVCGCGRVLDVTAG